MQWLDGMVNHLKRALCPGTDTVKRPEHSNISHGKRMGGNPSSRGRSLNFERNILQCWDFYWEISPPGEVCDREKLERASHHQWDDTPLPNHWWKDTSGHRFGSNMCMRAAIWIHIFHTHAMRPKFAPLPRPYDEYFHRNLPGGL